MLDFPVTVFKYGVYNAVEAQSIPEGAASNSLNWLTKGDKIELRRGSNVSGTEQVGVGRVTSVHTAYKADGTAVYFGSYDRKVFYSLNSAIGPWTEIGTNILPAAANGEDLTWSNYATNAGAQTWFGSPNSSIYKIMTANPGDYADMYNSLKNFKGYLKILSNRMRMWRLNTDKTGVYGSYIDNALYTTITAEALGNGTGAQTNYVGTLAFKAGGAKRTAFGVVITDGTEIFTDNYNGQLTGSLGGVGTVNYMTGAYSVTFNTAPVVGVNNVTATYQWEDSTNKGIADFTKDATRLAGQGFVFRQDDGGGSMQNILTLGDTDYCFHEFKTWALTITSTDTQATNSIFRESVGIPYLRAAVSSSVGVFYIDVTDRSKPLFRKLSLNPASDQVVPRTVTPNINLEGYRFDQCTMEEWNDYIIFTGATDDSVVVNRMFLFHKIWGSIDILDYYPSCLTSANGTLLSGESISKNFVTLFSGFDDSDSLIPNFWEGNISELGIRGRLKKTKKLILEGDIQSGQSYTVEVSTDRGGWTYVDTIDGDGAYVDKGQAVLVGSNTTGSKEVGGGGDGVEAYHYMHELRLRLDKFENRKLRFVATGIGYVSITKHVDHDIRLKGFKIPSKYRV